MRLLLTFLFAFTLSAPAWGAAITSAQFGNWSSASTWTEGVVPNPVTDTATIATAHTVTITDSRTIPATTVEGSLVQGNGVVTTLGGTMTVGNGVGKDGTFTFGAGSELAHNGFDVAQNNSKIYSNATSGSWAKVTGTGNWVKGSYSTGPKMEIELRYVSFQNTGNIVFPNGRAADGGAGITHKTDIQHCVFVHTGTLTHGVTGVTAATCPVTFQYNDVRNTSTIIFYAAGTPADGTQTVKFNTFVSGSGSPTVAFTRGTVVENNVFDGYPYTNANGGLAISLSKNLFVHRNGISGSSFVTVRDLSVFDSNYLYSPSTQLNAHSVQMPIGVATVSNSVFELLGTEPNILNYTQNTSPSITKNLAIGHSNISLLTIASNPTTGTITFTGNTQVSGQSAAAGLVLVENSSYGTTGGTSIVSNNLLASSGTTPRLIIANVEANTVNITTANNNAMPGNDAESFIYVDSIGTKTGNLYGVDPAFADSSRKFTTYGAIVAGTDGTDTALLALFAATNGYNATTKTQSDTPSGVSIAGTPTSLVDWVRAGFTPTNPALLTAGEGGTYIGAVQPVVVQIGERQSGVGFNSGSRLRGLGFNF